MNQPRPPASNTRETATPPRPRADAPTFLLHWSLFVAFAVSLLAGLRIASDYLESPAGAVARGLLSFLPEGRVIELHVFSGWFVSLIALAYAVFMWRSRLAARITLRRIDLANLAGYVREGTFFSSASAWFTVHRVLTLTAFGLILLLALTGWMMYRGTYFGIGSYVVIVLHGIAAWLMVGYLLLHVITVLKAGTFWKMFRPRPAHLVTGAAGIAVATMLVGAAYFTDRVVYSELRVPRIDDPPVLDGEGSDPQWAGANPVRIHTARGANLPNGETVVDVRALHDGVRAYFSFRWADPQRSQKMTPLLKTAEGWRVLQSRLDINDENDYYEDKFAVIFSPRPALGSGTTHLGQDLIEGPHYRNPRGAHFTEDGSIVDLWHWKSVRSAEQSPAYLDDNYIGEVLPEVAPGTRHTGGYTQDPPGAPHPYIQNWTKVNADAPLNDTPVLPRFLPARPELLERLGNVDLDPAAHDDGVWAMAIEETVPYDAELDNYSIGTVLPGIVLDGVFQQDRADVRAEATWVDGFWTLEATRVLDPSSPYDVPFIIGQPVFLWVSVFNHTQTQHSQHLQPVRLIFED